MSALPNKLVFGKRSLGDFCLDPEVIYLNHGSFGATPRVVLAAQDRWRVRMERQPVEFMIRTLEPALRGAAGVLGAFIGARGDDIAFVDNATTGVNAVLRSLDFAPGDEIVFTNHGYGAVNKAIRYTCERSGATPVEVRVPFPIADASECISAIEAAITPRTKLAVLDHITSATGLVLPIGELIALCRERGVPVLVDGAHAPGMVPLDVTALGADYYTGNCHKWLCAAKGAGFLWVAPERQAAVAPLVISWGWGDGFAKAFDWPGTRDFTPWLTVTDALDYHKANEPPLRRAYCDTLCRSAAGMLAKAWDVAPTAPDGMRAAMATIALPTNEPATQEVGERIHDRLIDNYRIEVPIMVFADKLWVRISAQVYNEAGDYEKLRDAISQIL